ncbi:MAG: helix-turn-helix domain-containing protein [Candidatus Latescibacterota bacterium]|nr:MAG: helix-turn-helix domain-containing protein [Candidatus Latescibacterota bacterium]
MAGKQRLLTVSEVAQFLGVHAKTVYVWARRGLLPCIRLGRSIRFVPDDILRWISARKEG